MTLHNTGSMVIVKLTTIKETTMETEEEVTIITEELDTKETTMEITIILTIVIVIITMEIETITITEETTTGQTIITVIEHIILLTRMKRINKHSPIVLTTIIQNGIRTTLI